MFKSKNEILEILKKKDLETNVAAKKIFDMLSRTLTADMVSTAMEYITSGDIFEDVAKLPIPEHAVRLLEGTTEESKRDYLLCMRKAEVLEYMCMLADAFSVFRKDSNCMGLAVAAYSSYFTYRKEHTNLDAHLPQYFGLEMYENLVLLHSDKESAAYDLKEAAVKLQLLLSFGKTAGNRYSAQSDNPDLLYAYAYVASKVQMPLSRIEPEVLFRRAADMGHQRAKEVLRELWRTKGLCKNCGGKFVGFFSKKCSSCGRKKDY